MSQLARYCRSASPANKLYSRWTLHLSFASTSTEDEPKQGPGRPSPPPIRVAYTESAGRGVFATRRIEAGQLIHSAKPLLSHPSLSCAHSVCHFCLRKLKFPPDAQSQTQSVSFCSEECREQATGFYAVESKADWSIYDEYCRSQGLKYPLLAKRLACMVISGVAAVDSLDVLQPANLSPDIILKMEEEFELLKSAFAKTDFAVEQTACILAAVKILTNQWYTGVLARIRINAFRIELIGGLYEDLLLSAAASVETEAAVGNAVYVLPSFYNHDCDPNAHIVWIENADARLKALRDVDEGEELRICYIDASMDHNARQTLLSRGFGFRCRCQRCLSGD